MKSLNLKEILLSIFLVIFFSNFIQHENLKEFRFDKLKNQKITFKDISMKNGHQIYDDQISSIVEANFNTKSKIYQVKISDVYPIYHGCYDSIPNNNDTNNEEYLQFYDTKININLLLKNNLNKKIDSDQTYIVFNSKVDSFKFNDVDFILLSARDRRFFRNLERNYWILLQVKNKDVINSFCFIDGYTVSNDCFGDYNKDGSLDYMNWDFNKEKISLYSLKNNKFEIDRNHFIKVKQSKEQKEITKQMGVVMIYDLFDKKNSKWFYKL